MRVGFGGTAGPIDEASVLYPMEEDGGSAAVEYEVNDLIGRGCSKGTLFRGEVGCVRAWGRNFLPRCFSVTGGGILVGFGGVVGWRVLEGDSAMACL